MSRKEIGTTFIRDNSHTKVEIISNLKKGDVLRCIKTVTALGDVGMSGGTFRYESFIKGKEYKVHSITDWDFKGVAYVKDEDGSLNWAIPELFEVVSLVEEPKKKMTAIGLDDMQSKHTMSFIHNPEVKQFLTVTSYVNHTFLDEKETRKLFSFLKKILDE